MHAPMTGAVAAVHRSGGHTFSKEEVEEITLVAGLGVEGDAHAGVTVQHRSRVARDPSRPNLRQVHLIHRELIEELQRAGFPVEPGSMGENITTIGIDVLSLPTGARLRIGTAAVEVTGLRNPCVQLDAFSDGLRAAVLDRDDDGNLVRRAGIMGIVVASGVVRAGDAIHVDLPAGQHRPLEPV